MEKNNLKMWALVAGVVAVIIVFFLFSNQNNETNLSTQNTETSAEPESVQDTQDTDNKTQTQVAPISYADALVKYADRRIQLDKICQAHPNNVTYKDNTGIMIDNRSPQTRTVKVGTTFTIKPYGFKIIVLPDIYLKAKTILVDCDKSQNVATILVQE